MNNPWELSRSRHFNVHPDDERRVSQHNRSAKTNKQIERGLPPLPFIGNPQNARVILLAKNPNYSPDDEAEAETNEVLVDENINALRFESAHPFFYLDERFAGTIGHTFWHNALKDLIAAAVERSEGALTEVDVAGRISCLLSHPYRSRDTFDPKPGEEFPTQSYTDYLAGLASARPDVVFIVLGGKLTENRWRDAVSNLPATTVRLRNIQKPVPTRANMNEVDFERSVVALTR
jgi:hypothetical protein